ncbi:bone morphogenetic protein 1-like [Lineus longissimus]|uniref:bone morphogenetic protein 1-like n=1 Tax=Lineus longissimus TaxID=88925 RepID=UPI002B4E91F7
MQQNIIILVHIYAILLLIGCTEVRDHRSRDLEDALPIADMKFTVEDHHHFYPDEPPPPPGPSLLHNELNMEEEGFIPILEQVREIKVRRLKRAVTALKHRLWPNATVPYIMNSNTTDSVKINIYAAMAHWEEHTCIKFVPRTTEKDYIEFAPGRCGCCSYVGRQTDQGRQFVNISENCGVFGVIVHELGHTIGFWHEHSRPDRDKYIRIIVENIKPGRMENFYKKSDMDIDSLGQPYDYNSIMHYRKTTFTSNGRNTMEPVVERVYIGQRVSLSKGDIVQANLLYNCPKPNCNIEFHESKGNFSSPNYPMYYYKEHTCTWVVHTPKGHSVKLNFQDFQLEKSDNCTFDFIELRLGTSKKGKPLGRLCGVGQPGIIKAWDSMWIHFSSDSSIMLKGFKASFEIAPDDINLGDPLMMADDFEPEGSGSGAGYTKASFDPKSHKFEYETDCHQTLRSQHGTIESPLALAMSPSAVECRWTISAGPEASAIYLKIDHSYSRVEGESCVGIIRKRTKYRKKFNTPDVFDGQGVNLESYEPHPYDCGAPNGDKIQLNTTEAVIMWSSKYHYGFKLSYVIDYNECRMNQSLCDHKCVNTITGYRCVCQSGNRPDKDQIKCLPKRIEYADKCRSTLRDIRGKIHLENTQFEECGFEINLPAHYRIFLTFSQFNIPYTENCTKHFMMVYSGSEHNTKGRYCGTESPGVLTTPNGYIGIRIHVDLQDIPHMPYFTASYIAHQTYDKEACFHRLRGGGNFTSPKFPSKYHSHTLCIWKLTVHGDHVVRLHFNVLDVERTKLCHYDYVEVRDGRRRTSPFIGRFCGKEIPEDVLSTGKHMWVMFISDGSHSGRGFSAEFMPHKLNTTSKTNPDATSHHGNHRNPKKESQEDANNWHLKTNRYEMSTQETSTEESEVTEQTPVTTVTEPVTMVTEAAEVTVTDSKKEGRRRRNRVSKGSTRKVTTVSNEDVTIATGSPGDIVTTESVGDLVEVKETVRDTSHGLQTNSDLTVGIEMAEDTVDETENAHTTDFELLEDRPQSQKKANHIAGSENVGEHVLSTQSTGTIQGQIRKESTVEDVSSGDGSYHVNVKAGFTNTPSPDFVKLISSRSRDSSRVPDRDVVKKKKASKGKGKKRRKGRRRGKATGPKVKEVRERRREGSGTGGDRAHKENDIDQDTNGASSEI